MEQKKAMKKVWRNLTGAQWQEPAEKVLAHCPGTHPSLECWSSPAGAVEMAVFLQSSTDHPEGGEAADDTARVKIAYRSYHPKPFWFRRDFSCKGGDIDHHDAEEEFEVAAGKTGGRAYKTELVPDGVSVKKGANGAQIAAEIQFVRGEPLLGMDPVHFSVSFPTGRTLKCLCC